MGGHGLAPSAAAGAIACMPGGRHMRLSEPDARRPATPQLLVGGGGTQRCHEEQQHAWHSVPGSVTAFAGHKMPGAMLCSPYIVVPVLTPRASVRTSRFARPSWGKQGGGEGGGIGAFGSSLVPPKTQTLCCVPHPSSASRRRFRYRRQVHRILDAGARGAKHVAERKPAGAVSEPAFFAAKDTLDRFRLALAPRTSPRLFVSHLSSTSTW